MIISIVLLVAGLVLLIGGADFLIRGVADNTGFICLRV
jgi:Ca2+/Na+ antiporter